MFSINRLRFLSKSQKSKNRFVKKNVANLFPMTKLVLFVVFANLVDNKPLHIFLNLIGIFIAFIHVIILIFGLRPSYYCCCCHYQIGHDEEEDGEQKRSARPSTARRRPPKVKDGAKEVENKDIIAQPANAPAKKANIIVDGAADDVWVLLF